ncbi:hypothetical protein [Pseudogracilibacillus sp. SO30301A]|uniref:hypothetical protein n=1 Tax=Pseudogracilibacillus sp. SO30301A TaxID=3098291 RepID=UPI00300DC203
MICKKLNNLDEQDFAVLRGPFESGRQSPKSLGGTLLLGIVFQVLMLYMVYDISEGDSLFRFKETILLVYSTFSVILILLSIIYSIPAVYMKGQKMQYATVILVSQNIAGVSFYIVSLFLIGSEKLFVVNQESLFTIILVTSSAGILIFIITCIRFYFLLKKGEYRSGSKRALLRGKIELKSLVPIAILASTGLTLFMQYTFKNIVSFDGNTIFLIILGPILFYIMLFVLPEQLVILYCKTRFDSFNFDKDGNLKPLSNEMNHSHEH